MKNFGEFFGDQVENAGCIVLSHTDNVSEEKLAAAVAMLREENPTANLVTAPWTQLDGATILAAMEKKEGLQAELDRLSAEVEERHHHHHDHEHEHHHHHHDEEECHDEHCCCHHHHHDHDHEHEHEHEHHHHHHHADEVFASWGVETTRKYTKEEISHALAQLQNEEKYGKVLRAKGIVAGENAWVHFDYVPECPDVREGSAGTIGRLCVIGCQLNEEELKTLFKA